MMAAATGDEYVRDSVKDYYGKRLKSAKDLKTVSCKTTPTGLPKPVREALSDIHDEVVRRYYGCGLVIPEQVKGIRILDLGSGSGRDCFALSKLVGENGYIVGIDMTDEQLEIANQYIDYHRDKFGYKKSNVEFVKGYIEKLTEAGLKENSFDAIISNCVVNLSPDKKAVLREAYKVLKVGGEVYFSDIYCDRNLPESARKHEVLWGECISGALFWKELFSLAKEVGFSTPRMVSVSPVPITQPEFKEVIGDAQFVSVTYRLFKLPETKQPARQVIYNGEIPGHETELKFDFAVTFKKGDLVPVDSELSTILDSSRYKEEFEFQPAGKMCCSPTTKMELNPFEYMEILKKDGKLPAPSCC
ncbi:arsenite methyltransferase-like isoform X2 [Gigantopelta aegis]|nr:arsenite methyltransferase-like isoform X2 [Gigantopelta aegis]XP_041370646.1 arsenite methyltransferase-like isoform X2 [Gigantopelta aegis]